jgi:hypothetical protein
MTCRAMLVRLEPRREDIAGLDVSADDNVAALAFLDARIAEIRSHLAR